MFMTGVLCTVCGAQVYLYFLRFGWLLVLGLFKEEYVKIFMITHLLR